MKKWTRAYVGVQRIVRACAPQILVSAPPSPKHRTLSSGRPSGRSPSSIYPRGSFACALILIALLAAACGTDSTIVEAPSSTDSAATTTMMANTDTTMGTIDDDDHEHDDPEVIEAAAPLPALAIAISDTDTAGIYDLAVSLTNFTIDADSIDGDPVDNEGHMHLLVDGVKIERFTDVERTIELEPGNRMVEVELNANSHLAYAIDGEPIRAIAMVDVPGEFTEPSADIELAASFLDGEVTGIDDRIEVPLGSVVAISVESDVDEEVHLHGYDIVVDVSHSSPSVLTFTADIPGRFEIELEASGTFLTELVVS